MTVSTKTDNPSAISTASSARSPSWPLLFAKERTESTFAEIPVIDFTDAKSADPEVRRALANEIRDACVNVGFFYLNNVEAFLSESIIASAIDAAKDFFALPEDDKLALDIHKSSNYKGYTALLGENTNPENRGDLHEGFDIGWEDPLPDLSSSNIPSGTSAASHNASTDGAMQGVNVWPSSTVLPHFRPQVLRYYHAGVALGKALFPLLALALDLEETFFDDKTIHPAAIMRLLRYPNQPPTSLDAADDRVQGIGAHTDYECFTILWQQSGVSALQVRNAQGIWIDAVPIPGTVVVNIGDQLMRWTNDVFKSTMHRAINRSGAERYSIPLFFGVDYDVPLTALPSCVSDDYPAQYEVVTAGEYVKSRLDATYAHSKQ